ncbi:hypothetical protein N9M15_05875 [Bacteroidia bacterium]|nr:hypothetical protein [Bacteroidia bacterium]
MECIVFLGVDGAGKSTIIKELKRKIEARGESVVVTHFRLKLFMKNNHKTSSGRPEFAEPWPVLIGYLKILYFVFIELLISQKIKRGTDYLIYDRNLTDCLVDGSRYRIQSHKGLYRLLRFREMFFSKTKRFILIGDPQQISNRKKELTLEETNTAILNYQNYVDLFDAQYLDTTRNSTDILVKKILDEFVD